LNNDTKTIIQQVRKDIASRNVVIQDIYNNRKYKDSIYSLVLKNGGNTDDAHDIFTQAIISFVQQCYSPVFEIKHQLGTYLYSIARYAWIAHCKKEKKHRSFEIENDQVSDYAPSIESKIISDERLSILKKGVTLLDEKCKKVMTLWATQLKMREIAMRMGYASEQVARKKKHQCLNKLKSILKDI
jgi:RNA polymerase sigma factor (sigma-70 family)